MLTLASYLYANFIRIAPEFNILIEDGHRHSKQAVKILQDTKAAGSAVPSKILTIGLGSKAAHPILQSADMLAYEEWQKMVDGDLKIYGALHAEGSHYHPELVDFDGEMVDIVTRGAERWMAERKTYGRRKPRAGRT
jgi:hypothetical protein